MFGSDGVILNLTGQEDESKTYSQPLMCKLDKSVTWGILPVMLVHLHGNCFPEMRILVTL